MQIGRGYLAQLQADNFISGTATKDSFPIVTPLRPLITNRAQFAFTYLYYSQGSTNPLLCQSVMREKLKATRWKRPLCYTCTYFTSALFWYFTRGRVVIPYRRKSSRRAQISFTWRRKPKITDCTYHLNLIFELSINSFPFLFTVAPCILVVQSLLFVQLMHY
jgi:hypothetical protein